MKAIKKEQQLITLSALRLGNEETEFEHQEQEIMQGECFKILLKQTSGEVHIIIEELRKSEKTLSPVPLALWIYDGDSTVLKKDFKFTENVAMVTLFSSDIRDIRKKQRGRLGIMVVNRKSSSAPGIG